MNLPKCQALQIILVGVVLEEDLHLLLYPADIDVLQEGVPGPHITDGAVPDLHIIVVLQVPDEENQEVQMTGTLQREMVGTEKWMDHDLLLHIKLHSLFHVYFPNSVITLS